jgi:hypothetical protein
VRHGRKEEEFRVSCTGIMTSIGVI